MVVMDSTTLMLLIDPEAKPPQDPKTRKPVQKSKERIEYLLETLNASRTQVLVPTPVLSEVLIRAGAAKGQYLNEISGSYALRIASFDQRAAIELSMLFDSDLNKFKKLTDIQTKAKIKFDRQIVAIAKVNGVKTIYSDDGGLAIVAKQNGISVVPTWDLPLRPVKAQAELEFGQAPGDRSRS